MALTQLKGLYKRKERELKRSREYRNKYLTSDRWSALRKMALQRADNRCQVCNFSENLHVHHRTYKTKGSKDELRDLTVLCDACHGLFHLKPY